MSTTRPNKLLDLSALLRLARTTGQVQRSVVWTNGCFDLLHAGHLRSLHSASQLGDVLIVGLNSDDSVRQLKGRADPSCRKLSGRRSWPLWSASITS